MKLTERLRNAVESYNDAYAFQQVRDYAGIISYRLNKTFKFWYQDPYSERLKPYKKIMLDFYNELKDKFDSDPKTRADVINKHKQTVLDFKKELTSDEDAFRKQSKETQEYLANAVLKIEKLVSKW